MHVERCGADARAVFVHGFAGDVSSWDALWDASDDALAAVRYDLRGFGASHAKDNRPFTHADDLLALLDALAIETADLIGVSMGGGVALNFALSYPKRVRRLVLISPGMVAWEWSEAWHETWAPIVAVAQRGGMEQARALFIAHPMFDSVREGPAGVALRDAVARYSGAHWIADHHAMMGPDVERLHALDAPTLLLNGADDLDEFKLIGDLIEGSAPNVRRIVYPGGGHMLHMQCPVRCARDIAAFLNAPDLPTS